MPLTLIYRLKSISARLLVLVLLSGVYSSTQAQTIGAELYYNYDGNGNLTVSLVTFVDCNAALIPDIQNVAVFETMARVARIDMKLKKQKEEKLQNNISNPCKTTLPCLKKVIYSGKTEIRTVPGGYDIVWRQCCLEEVIENLEHNPKQGYTLTSHISELALKEGNSAPQFETAPFYKVCLSKESESSILVRDTTDKDSLVLRLGSIQSDASEYEPNIDGRVGPENSLYIAPPPFKPASQPEGYSANQPFGADSQMKIDQDKALINLKTSKIGTYALAIAIDEYRNNKLIGTTQRIFFIQTN